MRVLRQCPMLSDSAAAVTVAVERNAPPHGVVEWFGVTKGGHVYWRGGFARTVLWIAAVTFFLSAFAAWSLAGSAHAAQALALIGAVLSPPVQEFVGQRTHLRAPAKLAFYAIITLLPVSVFFITIDGVALMEARALQRGFASAAQMERARQLKITTPAALAAHDEALRKAERDRICHGKVQRPPLVCFEPAHRAAAQAFAAPRLLEAQFQHVLTDVLGSQRRQFLAEDRSCQALIDRIEAEALPVMQASRSEAVDMLAALWAARLSESELVLYAAQAKPGGSNPKSRELGAVEDKIAVVAPQIDRQMAEEIKSWSHRIVLVPSGWRALLGVKPAPDPCKMVETSLQH